MRKITSILLALAIVLAMLPTYAAAAGDGCLQVSSDAVAAGETVTLTYTVPNETADVASISVKVAFDSSKIYNVTSVTYAEGLGEKSMMGSNAEECKTAGEISSTWLNDDGGITIPAGTVLFTAELLTKDDVTGSATFEVKDISIADYMADDLNGTAGVDTTAVTVTIGGETPAPVEDKVDTPVITPNGKTMEKDGDSVDITIGGVMTSGAAIFYTLGDQAEAEYTSSSAISLYTSGGAIFTTPGGINLGSSVVLKAWAKVGDLMSEVAEATFSIKSESSGGGGGGGGGSATPAKQFPYTDVAENDYFRKPVEWALKKGVLSAEYPSKFNPTMGATRSDMVYYLWLAKGSPAPTTTEMPFTDVAASADYYNAVLWAYENGITAGVSATEFAPNQTVTRAQAITFLYGVAGRPAAGSEPFDDVNAEDYFAAPVAWAYGKGITAGTSANLFSPDRGCQRAQIITFMALYFAD